MNKDCTNCLHNTFDEGKGCFACDSGLVRHFCVPTPCDRWELDRPHVAAEKPPLGCSPYYVNTTARICELCEAIIRYASVLKNHNLIKLWATEILYLNEMDRSLARTEKEKTWVEGKDGKLEELK